jgi:hypothetical protein
MKSSGSAPRSIATFPGEKVAGEVYAVQNEGGMAIHFLAEWRALELLDGLRRPAALVVKPCNLMIDHRLAVAFFPMRTPAVDRLVIAVLLFQNESAPEVSRLALLVIGVNQGRPGSRGTLSNRASASAGASLRRESWQPQICCGGAGGDDQILP